MINNAYRLENISLLAIERVRDIYIVALQKYVDGMYAQFPFVPIHKSVVEEFVSSAELVGTGVTSSIDDSREIWEKHGSAYFTIPPKEIWNIGISLLRQEKELSDFRIEGYFLFPPIYPATTEILQDFEGIAAIMDHVIGEKSDINSN